MKNTVLFASMFVFMATAQAAAPARHAAPVAAKAAAPAAPKQQYQEVSYDDLGKYLNQHIVVRTTLHTERSGTLVKYSGTAIDLKLDTGATLGLPRETIRSIGIPIPPADAPVPEKK